jgi:hypothetical protein
MNNKTILETLKLQPLTEEEKQRRHILGRWYGPIATCNEGTRNGRRYNRELWERALNDELFHEKIANKCLFLELGHPQDREETDMSKVCACIPEMPRIIDGDLCACVDILDTPNGRILKTLCDYGFIPGVSSRGSGDVMPNNDVDPETFFLETFDCVAIPAVKKARLSMCESLNSEGLKLKKALTESFNKASEEDKVIMKETLENLNISLEEAVESNKFTPIDYSGMTEDDLPIWDDDSNDLLTEEVPADEDSDETGETSETSKEEEVEEEPVEDIEAEENTEGLDVEENEASEEELVDIDTTETENLNTVGDAIELLQEYDDDIKVELEPIEIDGEEHELDGITSFVDEEGEEPILVLGVHCKDADEKSDDAEENIEQETIEETPVETIEEVEDTEDSADDNGDEEVIESLKEMVRQKEALETEVSDLRKAKSVGEAKEKELQEKLQRYRTAFRSTSAEAAKVPELEAKVKELTEKLTQSQGTVKSLTEKVNKAQQLKESIEGNKANERRLNEEVSRLTKKSETLEAKLEGQTKVYNEKLQERTNLAKSYKARFIETLTKYVESKANMLGVKPSEITSRLNESYTLKDVDAVCDEILSSATPFSRLPFGGRMKTSARISESVSKRNSAYEDDDLSDLYELAGLKK